MSLSIRRVKEISKRRRKSRTKIRKCDSLESLDDITDSVWELLVDEDDVDEDFPWLNAVHNRPIAGTPILFRRIGGWEYDGTTGSNVNLVSIVFMREYKNKSFEELRWEDYNSNRKGVGHVEEQYCAYRVNKTPATFSNRFEFIDPPPKNYLKHLDLLTTISDDKTAPSSDSKKIVFTKKEKAHMYNNTKERSILTNVDKTVPYHVEDVWNGTSKGRDVAASDSDTVLKDGKQARDDILEIFFTRSDGPGDVPYVYEQPCSNYYLPCENIELAYKNARPSKKPDLLLLDAPRVQKYDEANKFGKDYLFKRFRPYTRDREVLKSANCPRAVVSKTKNYLLGRDITTGCEGVAWRKIFCEIAQ